MIRNDLFWLIVMALLIVLIVGGGYLIREAVDTMDDEVRYLSPFRHDPPNRPFDYEIDAPEYGHRDDAA